MRISDWSSDVCSSDLLGRHVAGRHGGLARGVPAQRAPLAVAREEAVLGAAGIVDHQPGRVGVAAEGGPVDLLGLQQPIGRASCRDRVGQYGWSSEVSVSFKKKKRINTNYTNKL